MTEESSIPPKNGLQIALTWCLRLLMALGLMIAIIFTAGLGLCGSLFVSSGSSDRNTGLLLILGAVILVAFLAWVLWAIYRARLYGVLWMLAIGILLCAYFLSTLLPLKIG